MPRAARVLSEETVSLRNAKTNLCGLTKQAKNGVRVVITNHGTPIADLVKHGAGTASVTHIKHPGRLPKPIKLKGKGLTAAELVLKDREG